MTHVVKLIKTTSVDSTTCEVHLTRPSLFNFKAGQYVSITLPQLSHLPVVEQFRDMSISSGENDPFIAISFRKGSSTFKETLLSLKEGSEVEIDDASGLFTINKPDEAICVAGGIGITPFLSHVRSGVELSILYYSSDTKPPYAEYLQDTLNDTLTIAARRPDKNDFLEHKDKQWYIAGPPGFVTSVRTLLKTLMVSDTMVTTEEFPGYENN